MVVAALAGLAAACGGGDDPLPSGPARIDLVPAAEQRLFGVGATVQLTATPKDEAGNPVSATVTWSSDNTAVVTVNSSGLVTATGLGTAKVRASVGSLFQEVTIVVVQPQYNVNALNACASPDMRNFKIETESAHLRIVSGLDNPPGGFTTQDYQAFAATFESLVWPVLTENFGTPTDIDNNGKVIAFFTRAVNELTPPNSQSVVGGFFFGRDLFPRVANVRFDACPSSNEAEMFYMLVPDPDGVVNGNKRSVDVVRRLTIGVIGHEFQHLINSSRRLYINQGALWPERSYMEEGLSHIAEELLFYEASGGLLPRTNIDIDMLRQSQQRLDAFNSYMSSNSGRFSAYLREPSTNAPYQKDDDLATRGAIWSFLRYLADRGTPGTPFTEPVCAEPVVLTVGGRCRIDGPAAAQFNVAAGSSLGEFTIAAFAADLPAVGTGGSATDGTMSTTASATGSVAVTGPPNPWTGFGGAQLSTFGASTLGGVAPALVQDVAFHARLRALERRELPGRVAGARAVYAAKAGLGPRMYSGETTAPSFAVAVVEPVWSQLVNATDTGIVNLRGRFGSDITGAARDWAVANYADDVGLGGLPSQYAHRSWNFRSVLPALTSNGGSQQGPGTYPLKVHSLTEPVGLTMTNAGAAYYRLGVPSGATSTVRFAVGGAAPPANLKLVVVRTK